MFGGPLHTGLDFSNEGEQQRAIACDCQQSCVEQKLIYINKETPGRVE